MWKAIYKAPFLLKDKKKKKKKKKEIGSISCNSSHKNGLMSHH